MVVLPPLLEAIPGIESAGKLRVLLSEVVDMGEPDVGGDSVLFLLLLHPSTTNAIQPVCNFDLHTRSQSQRFGCL